MIRNISQIKKEQRLSKNIIQTKTKHKFKSHFYYLEKQYEYLFEFLVNYHQYRNIKHENSNQFILCFSLLSEILRKQKISIKLILNGNYEEAAEISRHIMQSAASIIIISQNQELWMHWFEQQKFEGDKLAEKTNIPFNLLSLNLFSTLIASSLIYFIKNNIKIDSKKIIEVPIAHYNNKQYNIAYTKNPRTIFANGKFRELLETIQKDRYYKLFQLLSSWTHPSIESLRSNLEFTPERIMKHHFIPRYNEERAEFILNVIYGLINDTIWQGFNDLFFIEGDVPLVLKKYEKIQDSAMKIFNRFYL